MKQKFKNLGNILELLNENIVYLVLNLGIVLTIAIFVYLQIENLPSQIPLFYNLSRGDSQLANRALLWIIPAFSLLFYLINLVFITLETKRGVYQIARMFNYTTTIVLLVLGAYLYRIVTISAINAVEIPQIVKLVLIPMLAALIANIIATPIVIKSAKIFGFMDDPLTHKHPGMMLKKPTPRAGGLAYMLSILIPGILLLPILESQKIVGILIAATICVITGIMDDRKDIHPGIRLFIQILTASIAVLSGIILIYIPNPFGEPIVLDQYRYSFNFLGTHSIYYVSVIIAIFWVMTTMNFMSFANGSDGVYAGLVFVSSFVIAILMFQSLDADPEMAKFVKLAALSAGAALGMALFTWPPQKLLWGFGATSAGLVIATLSIIGSTKVAVMLLVLLIPFLDGLVAVIRRLKRKQMPFWGDREHFHHKLLFRLGWSKAKVATFYWISTIFLGTIGILSSGRSRALWVASMSILFFIIIAIFNFIRFPKDKG